MSRPVQFICLVSDGKEKWWETYKEKPGVNDQASARKWAEGAIAIFNSTLRPGEKARRLLRVSMAKPTKFRGIPQSVVTTEEFHRVVKRRKERRRA